MGNVNTDSHKAVTASNIVDVSVTQKQREVMYGDYDTGIEFRKSVMDAILKSYKDNRNEDMPRVYQTLFMDVLTKLNRLAVSPNHIDSWHDLEGYSKLAKQFIINEEK